MKHKIFNTDFKRNNLHHRSENTFLSPGNIYVTLKLKILVMKSYLNYLFYYFSNYKEYRIYISFIIIFNSKRFPLFGFFTHILTRGLGNI